MLIIILVSCLPFSVSLFSIRLYFLESLQVYAHTFLSFLVLVLKAEGGVAVYLWDVVAGATALVWYVRRVAG